MRRLNALGSPIDLITVNDELGAEISDAGGVPYLASLADNLMRVSNVAHYVKIVKDKALAREMLASHELIDRRLGEGFEDPRAVCARNIEILNSLAAQHQQILFLGITDFINWRNFLRAILTLRSTTSSRAASRFSEHCPAVAKPGCN